MAKNITESTKTLGDLPDVPLRIIFNYLSNVDIFNLRKLGDDRLTEYSLHILGELGMFIRYSLKNQYPN